MNKVLIHISYPLWRKNALVAYARALELQDQGDEVTVTYCAAKGGTCVCNHTGNPVVCGMCRSAVRDTTHELGLHAIGLAEDQPLPSDPKNVSLSDRKELVEGVLSGLISTFRLLPKDIKRHPVLRVLKRRSYQTALRLIADMHHVMDRFGPDRFEVFNGRQGCSKFGLLAAKRRGIPFNTLEVTARKRAIVFQGHTAHDRKGVQQRVLKLPVDMELAETFYSARRQPRSNKFVRNQDKAFQPPSGDGYRQLVTFFLSSQDEFESLGKSWKSTFPPDHAVIGETCKRFPDIRFCIRFHPNQAGIKSDITSGFDPVRSLPNVCVYGPTDHANTYELIDQSDVVVAFNSTVAVEACWVGKPAVMLGPSFYDELEVAYTPPDLESFWQLLAQNNLPAKDRSGAAQLAYYVMRDGDDLKYIEPANGDLKSKGFKRKHAWRSVMARHTSTLCQEFVKLFVRAA